MAESENSVENQGPIPATDREPVRVPSVPAAPAAAPIERPSARPSTRLAVEARQDLQAKAASTSVRAGASVGSLASLALREFEAFDSEAQAKKNIVLAIEGVAQRLGNTPTVCRKCYIHPEVIEAYLDGSMLQTLRQKAEAEIKGGLANLRPEEAAVVALLQQRLKVEAPSKA